MTAEKQRGQAYRSFDPEAEQEVDFARYARLLAVRWWVLAAGLVIGALVGYGISSGGTQLYSASATVYLGQPYSAGGGSTLQTIQTNPATVSAIVHSASALHRASAVCKVRLGEFRGGVSTKNVSGTLTRLGQNPIVQVSVRAKHAKAAACVANDLAGAVVQRVGGFARAKIANFKRRISDDANAVASIQKGVGSSDVSATDKLIIQLQIRNFQEDQIAAGQLLNQAQEVEAPRVLTNAFPERVTARSRRNTVVVAALIGLVIGALVALLWDRVAPKLTFRNGE
jgi:capsular polysaccharide biosynthesis protein